MGLQQFPLPRHRLRLHPVRACVRFPLTLSLLVSCAVLSLSLRRNYSNSRTQNHNNREEVYRPHSPIQLQLAHTQTPSTTAVRRFSASADMLLRYTGGGSSSASRGAKKQLLQPPHQQQQTPSPSLKRHHLHFSFTQTISTRAHKTTTIGRRFVTLAHPDKSKPAAVGRRFSTLTHPDKSSNHHSREEV